MKNEFKKIDHIKLKQIFKKFNAYKLNGYFDKSLPARAAKNQSYKRNYSEYIQYCRLWCTPLCCFSKYCSKNDWSEDVEVVEAGVEELFNSSLKFHFGWDLGLFNDYLDKEDQNEIGNKDFFNLFCFKFLEKENKQKGDIDFNKLTSFNFFKNQEEIMQKYKEYVKSDYYRNSNYWDHYKEFKGNENLAELYKIFEWMEDDIEDTEEFHMDWVLKGESLLTLEVLKIIFYIRSVYFMEQVSGGCFDFPMLFREDNLKVKLQIYYNIQTEFEYMCEEGILDKIIYEAIKKKNKK